MTLLSSVAGLELMPHGQDEHNFFGGKPTVFRDISIAAAGKDELPPALFRSASEQRIGQ